MVKVSIEEFSKRVSSMLKLFPTYGHCFSVTNMDIEHAECLKKIFDGCRSGVMYQVYYKNIDKNLYQRPILTYDHLVFQNMPKEIRTKEFPHGVAVSLEEKPHSFPMQVQVLEALYGLAWKDIKILCN